MSGGGGSVNGMMLGAVQDMLNRRMQRGQHADQMDLAARKLQNEESSESERNASMLDRIRLQGDNHAMQQMLANSGRYDVQGLKSGDVDKKVEAAIEAANQKAKNDKDMLDVREGGKGERLDKSIGARKALQEGEFGFKGPEMQLNRDNALDIAHIQAEARKSAAQGKPDPVAMMYLKTQLEQGKISQQEYDKALSDFAFMKNSAGPSSVLQEKKTKAEKDKKAADEMAHGMMKSPAPLPSPQPAQEPPKKKSLFR